jgi:glycyl-tRNA synthetase
MDRSFLAVLFNGYYDDSDKKRVILKITPKLAPYKVAVFPLLANKEELVSKAKTIYQLLSAGYNCAWDDRGNIGKRYFAQDEIGTPWCITVDFQTLEDDSVTVRDRDSAEQIRVSVDKLEGYIQNKLI